MKTQPHWLDKNLFPFESKWLDIDGNSLHYIDEGTGPVLLFVHGTPEWSFGYRDLVKELRKTFRCVAFDMLGFGLSDKPVDGDYTCPAHGRRLEKFISKLGLKNLTLVANDFGGGIGMSYCINHPDNIARIVIFNTWMWSLKDEKRFSMMSNLMSTRLGKFLYLNMNFSVNVIMPSAYGNKKLLTKEIHKHYREPLSKGNRTAAHQFAKELVNASDWWQGLWENLDRIENKPFLILWGMKDTAIRPRELEKWTARLPNARVIKFQDAGHFVQEEKPVEMISAIRQFVAHTSDELHSITAI